MFSWSFNAGPAETASPNRRSEISRKIKIATAIYKFADLDRPRQGESFSNYLAEVWGYFWYVSLTLVLYYSSHSYKRGWIPVDALLNAAHHTDYVHCMKSSMARVTRPPRPTK